MQSLTDPVRMTSQTDMLSSLDGARADQTPLRLLLSTGTWLEGIVVRCGGDEIELRHADGSRSVIVSDHVIATTIP